MNADGIYSSLLLKQSAISRFIIIFIWMYYYDIYTGGRSVDPFRLRGERYSVMDENMELRSEIEQLRSQVKSLKGKGNHSI